VTRTLTRMSVLGSAFLGILAAAPPLTEKLTGLTAFRGFAGTSLLILVGVATDTARKIKAEQVRERKGERGWWRRVVWRGGRRTHPPLSRTPFFLYLSK